MSSVVLQVYDLSQGLARSMSRMILGHQVDGIWHTSVVVYGLEYFYGGGVAFMQPKTTPYGVPVQELPMGQTTRTKSEFESFLLRINPRYSVEGYHILYHNCNNFTNDCLQFLLGQSLPSHITDLPMEFLNTSLGKSLEPMISRMMQMTAGFGPSVPRNTEDLVSHEIIFSEPRLRNVTSHDQLHSAMKSDKTVIIYWEAERILEYTEDINGLPEKFPGTQFCCVDSARYPYLAPVEVPQIHVYEKDKLVVSFSGYDIVGLERKLGRKARPKVQFSLLNWTKPQLIPINWNSARNRVTEELKQGKLSGLSVVHLSSISKWLRRAVVFNIPEFVSALISAVSQTEDPAPFYEVLASIVTQTESNEVISTALGRDLVTVVSKGKDGREGLLASYALIVNLQTHPAGKALLKVNASTLFQHVSSGLSSDQESVVSAAAKAFLVLKQAVETPLTFEDAQEHAVLLLDRLGFVREEETVLNVASALASLMEENGEVVDLIVDLGVETAETRMEGNENERVRDIGKELKSFWSEDR